MFELAQRRPPRHTIRILVALAVLVSACHRTNDPLEDRRKAECPDLPTWKACEDRINSTNEAKIKAGKAAEAKAEAEAAASRAKVAAETKAKSAPMTRDERAAWIRHCVMKANCKEWQIEAIVDGAPAADLAHAHRTHAAASTEKVAQEAADGGEISALPVAAITVSFAGTHGGFPMLDLMPTTTLAAAKKDPAEARGKAVRVSGRVVEIRKKGNYFEGTLATGDMTFVRFLTSMSTRDIFEDSWATFRGVFLQEYNFPNVSGGQTRSLLVAGAFDIADNRVALK